MARSVLEAMRLNPAGDWTIADIDRECRRLGISVAPPRGGGSHWKVWYEGGRKALTIPARRPLKPVYVRLFVTFVDEMGVDG